MSVVLWPRQEVLQLITPQLSTVGKSLHLPNVGEVARRLLEHRNEHGRVNLAIWLNTARAILKWNDHCIYLFWEMLQLAVHYLNAELLDRYEEDNVEIEVECVLIFLILHVNENTSHSKTGISSTNFDSVWPLNPDGEVYPSSPTASPSSPVRENNRLLHRALSPIGSPRSPRNSSPQSAQSPRRTALHTPSSPRTPRVSTQHLHSVRSKIPIILRALSWGYSSNADEDITAFISEDPRKLENSSSAVNLFVVDRKIADFLGMMICGGYSRDQCVNPFSSLHPVWASADNEGATSRSMNDMMDTINLSGGQVTSVDYLAWINMHLSMNDVLYPVTLAPSTPGVTGVVDSLDPSVKDNKSQIPHRVSTQMSSLSRFNPSVINGCCTTIIHSTTTGMSRTASFRQRSATARMHDGDRTDMFSHGEGSSMRLSRLHSQSVDLSDTELESVSQDFGISGDALMDQDPIIPSSGHSPQTSPWKMKTDDTSDDDFESGPGRIGSLSRHHQLGQLNGAAGSRPDLTLPQLYINYSRNARLYMISPYYSATITGCNDSHIVIGSVYGALILNGCENVKITAACRKVIVINCFECELNIAALSCTIVLGDSRNLSFGPHNAPYRNLRNHLRVTNLVELIHQPRGSNAEDEPMISTANAWSQICDVNACLEASTKGMPTSPDFHTRRNARFPLPSSSTAMIQTPDQFRFVTVPLKAEYVGNYENLVIAVPPAYLDHVRSEHEKAEETKLRIISLLSQHSQDAMQQSDAQTAEDDKRDLTAKLMTSSAISKRFMEWLVASDNIQEVLDLIRMDSERTPVSLFH